MSNLLPGSWTILHGPQSTEALWGSPAPTVGTGWGEGGCWHRCLGPCQRGILRITGVNPTSAAAALCRPAFLPRSSPTTPLHQALYSKTKGCTVLTVEGKKSGELWQGTKQSPNEQFSLTWSTNSLSKDLTIWGTKFCECQGTRG